MAGRRRNTCCRWTVTVSCPTRSSGWSRAVASCFYPRTRGVSVFGYHGSYCRFNLSRGSAQTVPLSEVVLRRFLGGVGLGTYLLHHECPTGVEPFAPEAPLVFSLSPLVGNWRVLSFAMTY